MSAGAYFRSCFQGVTLELTPQKPNIQSNLHQCQRNKAHVRVRFSIVTNSLAIWVALWSPRVALDESLETEKHPPKRSCFAMVRHMLPPCRP